MVCCVVQATNLVNNYRPRNSARTFVSRQEASNKIIYGVSKCYYSSYISPKNPPNIPNEILVSK